MKIRGVGEGTVGQALESVRSRFEMTPKVAFAGFGNAGKSSLFNAIYGDQRASVSMRTDETRETQIERRFGIDFTDTPGIGTSKFSLKKVEQMAVFDRQHVVVHVLNGATAISSEDEALHELLAKTRARRLTVVNKMDLLDEDERSEFADSVAEKLGLFAEDFVFVSAKKGINIDLLVERIAAELPEAMKDAFIGQQRVAHKLRAKRVRALTYSKATACAGVALTPIPIADIVVITPIQIALVASIGYLHGVDVTRERILELLSVLGVGVGLRLAARQIAKLVPGAGSVVSAGIAFTGTVALGETANVWFSRNMSVPADELRELFRRQARDAKDQFERESTTIEEDARAAAADLEVVEDEADEAAEADEGAAPTSAEDDVAAEPGADAATVRGPDASAEAKDGP